MECFIPRLVFMNIGSTYHCFRKIFKRYISLRLPVNLSNVKVITAYELLFFSKWRQNHQAITTPWIVRTSEHTLQCVVLDMKTCVTLQRVTIAHRAKNFNTFSATLKT